MLDRVLDFLKGREAPTPTNGEGDLKDAVTALLVEAARMDSSFDATERATIERLLTTRYKLSPADAHRLIASAEQKMGDSTQLFPFTREICRQMAPETRVEIIEMLWKVAYSDGSLDAHEDMLVRRVAGLIHVTDRERADARRRAQAKLALREPPR